MLELCFWINEEYLAWLHYLHAGLQYLEVSILFAQRGTGHWVNISGYGLTRV